MTDRHAWLPALAAAGVVGAMLCSCSGGGGGGGASDPQCTRSCEGKQCGPDGCGGSCGGCDDGNQCTADACSASGTCSHQVMADGYTCSNLTLEGCEGGAEVSYDCRDVCQDYGYDMAGSCVLSGQPNVCACGHSSTACNQSSTTCYSTTAQISCDPTRGMWTVQDCGAYCTSRGYSGSAGCRSAVGFCTCVGTVAIGGANYACHSYGGSCGGQELCCGGLGCSWFYNGGNSFYACDTPAQCAPECMQGSVCCGGAFCSGVCIGNPCCR